MRKYTLYIIYSIILLGITACINDRYPSIYEQTPDPLTVNNGEDEANRIPILPTFANPSYKIVTRGSGTFNDWEEDSAHWMGAPFHTFAYWSAQGNTDYTKRAMPHCLLYNDTLKLIDAQGNVKFWQDTSFVERYYPNEYSRNRYKFFTFFCDSLVPTWHTSNTDVKASFTLDGASDVIHSFAYHSDSIINVTLEDLPFHDDIYEMLKNDKQKMLYTTIAGSRGINPLFHLNHMLCRFDINIQGTEGVNSDYSFLKMLIDELTLEAPKQVTLKVADDAWTEQSYEAEVKANTLLTYEANATYHLNMYHNRIQNTTYNRQKTGFDYDNILREWEQVMGEQDTAYFYVGDVTKRNLCKTILLPPMMTYHLTMKGRAMSLSNDGKLVLNKDGRYYRDVTSESEISLREDGMTVPFKAGTKYTLTVYVYSDGGRISATITGIDDEQWSDEYTFDDIHD